LSEIMPYIWLGVILFAFILKVHTFKFFPAWFIPSAFASFIMSLLKIQVWFQAAAFFAATFILLIFSHLIYKNFISSKNINLNEIQADSLIGRNAIVTEEINNYKNTGTIRINGLVWDAQAEDDDIIYESGLVVIILKIDGMRLICSR